jgi:hypothetical protein
MDMSQITESQLREAALVAVKNMEGVKTVSDAARYVPVQYFGVMTGQDAPDYQDGTFIVKRSNIIAIKRYVRSSLELPFELDEVEDLLGYKQANVVGLEPSDIKILHENIRDHAKSWPDLERKTKDLGGHLDIFSSGFLRTGDRVVERLKTTEGYQNLTGTIDTMTPRERAAMAAIPLGFSATERVQSLIKFLDLMKQEIVDFYILISEVKAKATTFSRTISEELLPAVKLKIKHAEIAGFENDAYEEELRREIKELEQQISEKLKEYDQMVGYAFSGLVFGPIGVGITGGIFGAKAERVRADKNKLLDQHDTLLKNLHNAKLSRLLNELGGQLANTKSLMVDAEKGAKNLEDVWAIIWLHIEESVIRLRGVDNVLDLNLFVLNFQAVVDPWRTIKGHAIALSAVFNEVAD